ncbi:MAG: hypothetical protein JWN51_902 [Phycisphaerales bacterium]|nr:hypothetical protein [Phycisphaerales bacterium]
MLHDRRYVLGAVLRALPTFAPAVVLIMRIERSWLFPVATLINMVSVWRLVAFSNRTRRLALQAELLAQGLVPQTCFHCGYDLRASHGCCSECGAVIQQ